MNIRNRKSILINSTIAAGQPMRFNYVINNIPFRPTEMIVRSIALDDSNNGYIYYIRSNLVSNEVLGIVRDNHTSISSPQTTFIINNAISGLYSFDVIWGSDDLVKNAILGTDINIVVEFIEYERVN